MKKTMLCLVAGFTFTSAFTFDSFNDAMKAGDVAKSEKKYAEAAVAYKAGYEKAAGSSQKYESGQRYARALFDSRKREAATQIGKEVMELPDISPAQKQHAIYMYAWYLQMAGKHAESEKILEEALKKDQNFEFYDIYVNCLVSQKKINAAKSALMTMEKLANNESLKKRVIQKKERIEKAASKQ